MRRLTILPFLHVCSLSHPALRGFFNTSSTGHGAENVRDRQRHREATGEDITSQQLWTDSSSNAGAVGDKLPSAWELNQSLPSAAEVQKQLDNGTFVVDSKSQSDD